MTDRERAADSGLAGELAALLAEYEEPYKRPREKVALAIGYWVIAKRKAVLSALTPTTEQIAESANCSATTDYDALVEQALTTFNGGLVRVPDESNPRGYTVHYKPKEAMAAAIRHLSAREAKMREALRSIRGISGYCEREDLDFEAALSAVHCITEKAIREAINVT